MIGPEGAAQAVGARLALGLADQLAALEAAWGPAPLGPPEPDTNLPPVGPKLIAVGDRSRLEPQEWPAVLIVLQRMGGSRLAEVLDDGTKVFAHRYVLRTYGFAHSQDWDAAALGANRLTVAMRLLFLAAPRLDDDHVVDVTSLAESYAEVGSVRGTGRSVSRAHLELAVDALEPLSPSVAGRADTIQIVVSPL
jgi:hypothetical protein